MEANQPRFQTLMRKHLKEHRERSQLLRAFCIHIADIENFSKLNLFEISNINFAFDLYDSGNLISLPMALANFNCQSAANLYVQLKYHILISQKVSSNFSLEEDKTLISCYYHYYNTDRYLIGRTKKSCLSRIYYWKRKLKNILLTLNDLYTSLIQVIVDYKVE